MGTRSDYLWMDGKLVEFEKATVHFLNRTLHYGVGVFEGIRCYNTEHGPAVFRLKEHVERLFDSAHVLGLMQPAHTPKNRYAPRSNETVAANGFAECYIRPLFHIN